MNRTHENSLHTKIGTEWNGMISMWNGPFSKLKKTNKKKTTTTKQWIIKTSRILLTFKASVQSYMYRNTPVNTQILCQYPLP